MGSTTRLILKNQEEEREQQEGEDCREEGKKVKEKNFYYSLINMILNRMIPIQAVEHRRLQIQQGEGNKGEAIGGSCKGRRRGTNKMSSFQHVLSLNSALFQIDSPIE